MAELEKAFLTFEGKNRKKLPFLFNPESITLSRSNEWTSTPMPGRAVTTAIFGGQQSGSMSFELIFDTTDTGGPVTKYTSELLLGMEIDPDLPGAWRSIRTCPARTRARTTAGHRWSCCIGASCPRSPR